MGAVDGFVSITVRHIQDDGFKVYGTEPPDPALLFIGLPDTCCVDSVFYKGEPGFLGGAFWIRYVVCGDLHNDRRQRCVAAGRALGYEHGFVHLGGNIHWHAVQGTRYW